MRKWVCPKCKHTSYSSYEFPTRILIECLSCGSSIVNPFCKIKYNKAKTASLKSAN